MKAVLSEPVRPEETYLLVVGEGERKERREKGRRRSRRERSVNSLKILKD